MKKIILLLVMLSFLCSCRQSNTSGISKVSFSAGACFGKCPVFTMSVDSIGKASYKADMNNEKDGSFTTTIKQPQLDSLWILLKIADPSTLKDEYTENITDLPSFDLNVTFKDGTIKKIHDYGNKAPKKLHDVFAFFMKLRNNQDWN